MVANISNHAALTGADVGHATPTSTISSPKLYHFQVSYYSVRILILHTTPPPPGLIQTVKAVLVVPELKDIPFYVVDN